MTYYIYHIPGIKIGCTTNLLRRISSQGFDDYEILETHEDIYVASERERFLQIQYGYSIDNCSYVQSRKNWEIACRNGGAACTEAQNAVRRTAFLGKKHSEDAKNKMKESTKKWWNENPYTPDLTLFLQIVELKKNGFKLKDIASMLNLPMHKIKNTYYNSKLNKTKTI